MVVGLNGSIAPMDVFHGLTLFLYRVQEVSDRQVDIHIHERTQAARSRAEETSLTHITQR